MNIMAEAFRYYRANNPRSRAPGPIIYARNGSEVRQRVCVLCGERGPTWCARYAITRRAAQWEAEHDCSAKLISRVYDPILAMSRLAGLD